MIEGGLCRQLPCTHAAHLVGVAQRARANSKWAKITFPAKYDGVAHTNSLSANGCRRCAWQMIVRSKSTDFSEWPPSLRSAAGRSFSEWGAAFAALGIILANG